MIGKRTVFVVGAGASHVYGLPLGSHLLKRARTLTASSGLYQLLRVTLGSSNIDADLQAFVQDITLHPCTSIDAYLETRWSEARTMEIGRHMIAALMGEALAGKRTKAPSPEDWLGHLVLQLVEGAQSLEQFVEGNSGVRFVTFNFDSIIEDRLAREIRRAFRPCNDDLLRSWIKVVHVHGQLTQAPPDEPQWSDRAGVSRRWQEWLRASAPMIKVVLDEVDDTTLYSAQKALKEAQVICFLGFSYRKENLDKLSIHKAISEQAVGHRPEVFGSAVGVHEGDRERFALRVPGLRLGSKELGCCAMLQGHHICRD